MSYSNPMHHADGAHAPTHRAPRDPEAPMHPAVRYVLILQHEKSKLREALQAVLALDVKGHQLQDRLQFSDAGRALLAQCRAALDE